MEEFWDKRPAPSQQEYDGNGRFHPHRCIHDDGVAPSDLVVSVALTRITSDPDPSLEEGNPLESLAAWVASFTPGDTLYFLPHIPQHALLLTRWLQRLDVCCWMNGAYDIKMLRAGRPSWSASLQGRQFHIDLSHLAFLHNELRPEKSLKNLGPVLGRYSYDPLSLVERFKSALSPAHRRYNCQDSHNTVLAISELANRILRDFPRSSKLSRFSLRYFSDMMWSTVRMEEAGVPMHRPSLESLERRLLSLSDRARQQARKNGLLLSGEGSPSSKLELLQRIAAKHPAILDSPLLQRTVEKKELSFKDANRSLCRLHLEPDAPEQELLKLADVSSTCEKLVSSYTFPLLRHSRKEKDPPNRSSCLLPSPLAEAPGVELTFPSWYITPSAVKDTSGSEGGTQQARMAAKNPSFPTFPRLILKCLRSRWKGGVILKMDLSQNEMRSGALLSGEPFLLNAFLHGWDCHARTAVDLWEEEPLLQRYPNLRGAPVDKWRKMAKGFKDREGQVGKRVNFAAFFRAGALKMAMSVLGDIGEALPLGLFQKAVELRPLKMPVLWQWQRSLIRQCLGSSIWSVPGQGEVEYVSGDDIPVHATRLRTIPGAGFLSLPFTGHSRWFMGGEKYDVNEIVNFPIQTTAAILLNRIMAFLHRHLDPLLLVTQPPIQMFGNIYDALAFDCRDSGEADRCEELLRKAVAFVEREEYWRYLQDHYGREVPLGYDIDRSDR